MFHAHELHFVFLSDQGVDPATDFRGVGILGLLQPFAASLSVETLPFMSNIVNLSHNPSQGFPFMVLSLNVSNIVLKALKDGILDKYVCILQNSTSQLKLKLYLLILE
jgi:hypothetical protein